MMDTLLKINKNKRSKTTGGIYHELVFQSGRKCYVDPENRNYWNNGWGHIIDNYPDTKGYGFHSLRAKTDRIYDADSKFSITPPEPEEPKNNINDLFEIQ
tara:strand:- start:264 stop:563 length:300 start_codon:yes stop_codon:yes gene_type:complete